MTEVEYKDPTTTLAYISSDPPRPVGPVHPTGRTGRRHAANSTGQTGPTDRSDRSHGPVRPVYAKQKGCTLNPQVYSSTAP